MIYKQKGVVPIIVLIALVSASIGGFIGFNLGGGTFFSFGVGAAVVFLLYPSAERMYSKFYKPPSSNDQ
ncbi:MAG: hypothetical protein P8N61_02135 [Porticoccaceae bacterium]|nr:hypothetical protein [Porticoccaceae bacterium]